MKNISIKKVAVVCAAVMVISMVPIFAADTNATTTIEKHLKHQYKYQNGLKNSNAYVNSDHAQLRNQNMNCTENCAENCTENCDENQFKYGYLNKNRVNNCTGNCTS